MRKVLVVSSDFPYPPNHGGRKDVWEKILALKDSGHSIDLIATVNEIPAKKDLKIVSSIVENTKILKRKKELKSFLSLDPMQLKSREDLKKVSLNKEYDYVILEGDYVLPILENQNINGEIIFRMHNDEKKYFLQLMKSEKSLLKKFYYFTESIKFKRISHNIISHLETIWFISKDEMDVFNSKNRNFNGYFVPPHVNPNNIYFDNLVNRKVLFIGSLFMVNNVEGVKWYLQNIHDDISNEFYDYELHIAGNSKGTSLSWLKEEISKRKYADNIFIYDSPENLNDLYSKCSIFINPMRHGAGLKLKTVEALQNGLAVVSTSVGAEGTGLKHKEHILVSDKPNDYINYLRRLLVDEQKVRELVLKSHQYLKKEFDLVSKLSKLIKKDI